MNWFKENKETTLYFKNGILHKISPFKQNPYTARYIVSDGKKYDLYNPENVVSIPIPNFEIINSIPRVTESMDYILRMISSNIRNNGNHELSILLLKKASDLMFYSPIGWMQSDYMRLVDWLLKDGKIEEAKKYTKIIKDNTYDVDDLFKKINSNVLSECKNLDTNLVVMSQHEETCAYCSKLQGRVYCIDGKDKRFPLVPKLHDGCRHRFFPFIYGCSSLYDLNGNKVDPIVFSNRPFIDERTSEQIEAYERKIDEKRKKYEYEIDQRNYYILKSNYPDICPKSFYAYRKLKETCPSEFKKLERLL